MYISTQVRGARIAVHSKPIRSKLALTRIHLKAWVVSTTAGRCCTTLSLMAEYVQGKTEAADAQPTNRNMDYNNEVSRCLTSCLVEHSLGVVTSLFAVCIAHWFTSLSTLLG